MARKIDYEKIIAEKAVMIVRQRNPYKEKAIKYYIASEPRYIYNGISYSESEIDATYLKTVLHDVTRGYNERMAGYYDKWYRVCHADDGLAYDVGQNLATKNPKCPSEFFIIECAC